MSPDSPAPMVRREGKEEVSWRLASVRPVRKTVREMKATAMERELMREGIVLDSGG